MKNNLLKMLTIILLTVSCGNDDSNNTENQESLIIGTWQPIQEIFVNSNGNQTTNDYDACEQMGRTNINSGGVFTQTGYIPVSGDCEIEWDNTGNWEIINDNILRITLNGQVDNGSIGDYLIIELTSTTLKLDADTDLNSIEQEIYVFTK
jgi:hypothetical protein